MEVKRRKTSDCTLENFNYQRKRGSKETLNEQPDIREKAEKRNDQEAVRKQITKVNAAYGPSNMMHGKQPIDSEKWI